MLLSENLSALAEFRRTAWEFQQTFETPLKNLPAFVSTIVGAGEQWRAASVTLELVVFEPQNLIALLSDNAARSHSNLNRMTEALLRDGFKPESDYRRQL